MKPTSLLLSFIDLAVSLLSRLGSSADVSPEYPAGRLRHLTYAPAPADNPLKGFVPHLRADTTFPHSLEWDYTKLSDMVTGPTNFNWSPLESKLNAAASRGHQFFARFYLEWPGRTTGVPQYLVAAGLKLRTWTNTNTQPFPPAVDHTPDYEDPRLRAALTNFIHALGRRYDGNPRLGFIGLGLLGTWGEWHNSPRDEWFASKTVQGEVMDAYEAAFKKTKLVARYPAGSDHPRYADNSARAIEAARSLGYELHVAGVEIASEPRKEVLPIALTLTNTGVAPFYYDWPVELGVLNSRAEVVATWKTDWKLSGIVPGEPAAAWRFQGEVSALTPGTTYQLLLRVVNPLPSNWPARQSMIRENAESSSRLALFSISS